MDIEPPDSDSVLDDVFPIWDQLFADASYAHERMNAIQNKLKLVPSTSREPNRDALLKKLESAVLQVEQAAARIREFCGDRDFSRPEE